MKKIFILILVVLAVSLSSLDLLQFDNNSRLHIGACFVLNDIGHVLSKAYIIDNRVWNSVIGASFAMAVGINKEYGDAKGWDWEECNWLDIKDDIYGTVLGVVFMQLLEPISIGYSDKYILIGVDF